MDPLQKKRIDRQLPWVNGMDTNVIVSSWDRDLYKYILLQHENCLNSLIRMDYLLQSWKAFEWKIHSVLHEHEFKKKWDNIYILTYFHISKLTKIFLWNYFETLFFWILTRFFLFLPVKKWKKNWGTCVL